MALWKMGKGYWEGQFLEEEIQVANKHMKRCSMSLVLRVAQMKTTREITFHPLDYKKSKSENAKSWQMKWKIGSFKYEWW